jgi:hypothetical protein
VGDLNEIPRLIELGQRYVLKQELNVSLDMIKSDKSLIEKAIRLGILNPLEKRRWTTALVLANFYLDKLPSLPSSFVKKGKGEDLVFDVSEHDADDMEIEIYSET